MSNYKYVMQDNTFDCGIASLMTCFYNMGKNISKEEVLNNLNYTKGGINAYSLVNASTKLGIKAKGVKCDVDILEKKDLPCIAHIIKDKSLYHYVVLLNIDSKNNLEVFDPASGMINISKNKFKKLSTGIYILFNKLGIVKEKDNRFRNYLIDCSLENSKSIGRCIVSSLLLSVFTIISNYYLKTLMDATIKNDAVYLVYIFAIFLNIYIIKNVANFIKNRFVLYLNNRIEKQINKKMVTHLFHLPYKFFAKRSSGELASIINDVDNFKDIVNKIFVLCIVDFLMAMVISIYIAIFNIYFSILSYLILFLLLVVSFKYQNLLNDGFIKLKKSRISFTSSFIESLNSYNTIKNLNIEDKIISLNNRKYKEVISDSNNYTTCVQKFNFGTSLLNELYYLVIIFFSIILCHLNKMSLADTVLFSSLFNMIIGYFGNMSDLFALFKMYKSSVSRVLDILDVTEEVFKPSSLESINNIKLENVSFKLEDKAIFKDVSLNIDKGDKIFIEGASGIGKSTLMKLLLKYYEEWEGKILIDNIDIRHLSNKFIRSNISYVSQNETLFNDTLYNNMKIVCESKMRIKKALETCLVNEMFKDKKIDYNTIIEDNGKNLSGGERKKLIIARSLLKAKSVLILDEAFNEIGSDKEKQILTNIFNNYKDLTVLLISHRKTSKKLFNKTFLMKERK